MKWEHETVDELMVKHGMRCADGKCKFKSMGWKLIWKTITAYHYEYFWFDTTFKKTRRVWLLLKCNPRKWKGMLWGWAVEDELIDNLASEIRKEIDNEIIEAIRKAAK